MSILITGATGNVGEGVIRFLFAQHTTHTIIAGVRDAQRSEAKFAAYPDLQLRRFDFESADTFAGSFEEVDTLFLLRPPQIADVERVFRPMLDAAKTCGVKNVVLLSVQGADKMSFIPHAKIEKLIVERGFGYVFLRPSYFMQNLTTTLAKDIAQGTILLPAGRAKFNWIDVGNIGEAAAVVLNDFDRYAGRAIELTGSENLSFGEAVEVINGITKGNLKYKSPNLISFYRYKKRQGVERAMILVMMMLHFLPRLQKPPRIGGGYTELTGKKPTTLAEFVTRDM